MLAFKNMNYIGNKEIQCPCCHKESRYRVTRYSAHCQSQCIHCYNQFLACPESDCNFCVIKNKRALSYINRHISSKKQKTSMSYTFIKLSTKDCLFNNLRSVCPLCDVSFDNPTSLSRKNKLEINCLNCKEILLYCKICGYLTNATCHGAKKLQKHLRILRCKGAFIILISSPYTKIT